MKKKTLTRAEYAELKRQRALNRGKPHTRELVTSRLTEAQLSQMQKEWRSGKWTQAKLAQKYGISQPSVSKFVYQWRPTE